MYQDPKPISDKYERPGEIGDDLDFGEPNLLDKAKDMSGPAIEKIKKNWKKIAIVIVGVIILFFILDFFFLSIKTVNFSVASTEGSHLGGVGIKIYDAGGTEIAQIGGSESIQLRGGNYTLSAALSGYKQLSNVPFIVSENPSVVEIELERDWDIELIVGEFPQTLIEGQITGVFVTIRNNGEDEEIDFAFTGALDSRYMTINYNSPHNATNGETSAFIELKLKPSIKENLIKDELKGTIRIKGLDNVNAKKTVEFDLKEFDSSKLRVTGNASFGRVTEGETSRQKEIKIENRLDYPIENISIVIEIQNPQFSNATEVVNWFSFDREVPIDIIQPGDSKKVGIIVTVPIGIPFTGSVDSETISGKLIVKTDFWEKEVELDLIVEKSNVSLNLTGISSNLNISFDSELAKFPPEVKIFTLRNNGELPLKVIVLNAKCSTIANWDPLVTFDQSSFSEIPAGTDRTTSYTVQVPNGAKTGDQATCTISANFNDPRDPTNRNRLFSEKTFIINIG